MTMTAKKIGLAGKSGSGKDVVADYICERYGYKKIAVADAIREEVEIFLFNKLSGPPAVFDPINLEYNDAPKYNLVVEAFRKAVWAKPTTPEMRVLLQWWGTEYKRAQDNEYWIKCLVEKMPPDDFVVISDVRVPEEIDAIHQCGGEVWFVERPGVAPVGIDNHLTEIGLEGAVFDRTLLNDQTLENLRQKVDFIFQEC